MESQNKHRYKVFCKKLAGWKNPETVFDYLFKNSEYSFWLDSSKTQKNLPYFSYMGDSKGPHSHIVSYSLKTNMVTVKTKSDISTYHIDILSFLKAKLKKYYHTLSNVPFNYIGGYIGYLGYEIKALCGYPSSYQSPYPDSVFLFADRIIVFDHHKKEMYLTCYTKKRNEAHIWFEEIDHRIQQIKNTHGLQVNTVETNTSPPYTLFRKKYEYMADIKKCKQYLIKGESYQLCLTNKLTISSNGCDWFTLYKILRKLNPAPYALFFKTKDFAILSSSPESFLSIDKKKYVVSKPIKGTIRTSKNKIENMQLIHRLRSSVKDRAENIMIVDLIRNDLGKVCKLASITVPKLFNIESYETVHQLVSTIQGHLKDHITPIDVIQATFPGGSMTGAPKKRAIEILDTLEKKARGIYSGTMGFLSLNNTMNLNIAIRTMVVSEKEITIGTGGAILLKSKEIEEYQETMVKVKVLLDSIAQSKKST